MAAQCAIGSHLAALEASPTPQSLRPRAWPTNAAPGGGVSAAHGKSANGNVGARHHHHTHRQHNETHGRGVEGMVVNRSGGPSAATSAFSVGAVTPPPATAAGFAHMHSGGGNFGGSGIRDCTKNCGHSGTLLRSSTTSSAESSSGSPTMTTTPSSDAATSFDNLNSSKTRQNAFASFATGNGSKKSESREEENSTLLSESASLVVGGFMTSKLRQKESKKGRKASTAGIVGRAHGSSGMLKPFDAAIHELQDTPFANKVVSSLIAMLQGVEVLCNLAIMFLFKDDFAINPAYLTLLMSLIKTPWAVKPIWALLSDGVPLMGFRRKSYIIIGAALCCFSTIGMGTFGYLNVYAATTLLFTFHLGSAICNVIGEALVVEAGRREGSSSGAASTISTFFAFRKMSFAIMSYFSGFLLNYVRKEQLFVISTFMPLSVLVAAFCLVELPNGKQDLRKQIRLLGEVVSEPILKNSTIFIFILMATPSAGAAMFYFMTNDLKFGVELLGRMALFQSIASLAGILVYMTFFKTANIRRLLLWSTLIVTPFCFLPLIVVNRWNRLVGIPDSVFVLTDNVLMEFLGEFQVLPILVLAAQLCPPGLESTIYSFALSSFNLGLAFGAVISAGITAMLGVTSTSFGNLSVLVALCAATNYLPLLLIRLIPSQKDIDKRLRQARVGYCRRISDAFADDPEAAPLAFSGDKEFSDSGSGIADSASTAVGDDGSSRHGSETDEAQNSSPRTEQCQPPTPLADTGGV